VTARSSFDTSCPIVVAPGDPDGPALLLAPYGTTIAGADRQAADQAGRPEIVFSVKDVRHEHDRLPRSGVVFRQPPTKSEWGATAVFDDTCDSFIQLRQP
jgi:hypothetical protein